MKNVTEGAPVAESVPARQRVFLVEDHPIFRHGLIALIKSEPGLAVCGEATSAQQAVDDLRRVQTDLVIVDISLEGTNGIELIKQLRAEHESLPILVLSLHDESIYAMRALRAGANGYIMKRAPSEEFLKAVAEVLGGEIYVSPVLRKEIVFRAARGEKGGASPIQELTDRELEILALVGQGRGSREIAEQLHLSVKTIESHRLHMKDKLGLASAPELVRFAVQWVESQLEV
ncbi:MAG: response regulator transcription factor [Chthoniobacteraceae bacterium]